MTSQVRSLAFQRPRNIPETFLATVWTILPLAQVCQSFAGVIPKITRTSTIFLLFGLLRHFQHDTINTVTSKASTCECRFEHDAFGFCQAVEDDLRKAREELHYFLYKRLANSELHCILACTV